MRLEIGEESANVWPVLGKFPYSVMEHDQLARGV